MTVSNPNNTLMPEQGIMLSCRLAWVKIVNFTRQAGF